jgi:hypothetical protein
MFYNPVDVQRAIVQHMMDARTSGPDAVLRVDAIDLSVWTHAFLSGWVAMPCPSPCPGKARRGWRIEPRRREWCPSRRLTLFDAVTTCPGFVLRNMRTEVSTTSLASGRRSTPPLILKDNDLTPAFAALLGQKGRGILHIDVRMDVGMDVGKARRVSRSPSEDLKKYAAVVRSLAPEWILSDLPVPSGVMIGVQSYERTLGPRYAMTERDEREHGVDVQNIVAFVAGLVTCAGVGSVPWHFAVVAGACKLNQSCSPS